MTSNQQNIPTSKKANAKEYHCFCSKTYNSYAGLYLHLKTKHQATFQKYKNMKISKLLISTQKQDGAQIFKLKGQEGQQRKLKKIKNQQNSVQYKNKGLESIIKKNVEINNCQQNNNNNPSNLNNYYPFHPGQRLQAQSPFGMQYGQFGNAIQYPQYGQPWYPPPIGYQFLPQPSYHNYCQPPNMLQNYHAMHNLPQPSNYRSNYPQMFFSCLPTESKYIPNHQQATNKKQQRSYGQNNKFYDAQRNFDPIIPDGRNDKLKYLAKPTLCQTPNSNLEHQGSINMLNQSIIQKKEKSTTNYQTNQKRIPIQKNSQQQQDQKQ